jgi:hypothetical protein
MKIKKDFLILRYHIFNIFSNIIREWAQSPILKKKENKNKYLSKKENNLKKF